MIVLYIVTKIAFCLWNYIVDWNLFQWNSKNFLLRDSISFPKIYYYIAIVLNVIFRATWLLEVYAKEYNYGTELFDFVANVLDMISRIIWVILRFESEETSNIEKYRAIRYVPILPMLA